MVYSADSGETHLLNAAATHILEALERGPTSFADLLCEVQELMDDPEDSEAVALVREVLDSLIKLGLIQAHKEVS